MLIDQMDAYDESRGYEDSDGDDSHERDDSYLDEIFEGDDSQQASGGDNTDPFSFGMTEAEVRSKYADLQKRYSGQTRKVSELLQTQQQQEQAWQQRLSHESSQRRAMMEQLLLERTQDLPPEEQQAKLRELRLVLDTEDRNTEIMMREQRLGAVSRAVRIKELAAQYGVDESELENFRDPHDAEFFAARESQRRRQAEQTQKRQKRKTQKSDSFDDSRNVSAPPKTPNTIEDAESEFLRLAKRLR